MKVKKADLNYMISLFATVLSSNKKIVKNQETLLCPRCGISMSRTKNFCPHCRNFRNGNSELIRSTKGQFHF